MHGNGGYHTTNKDLCATTIEIPLSNKGTGGLYDETVCNEPNYLPDHQHAGPKVRTRSTLQQQKSLSRTIATLTSYYQNTKCHDFLRELLLQVKFLHNNNDKSQQTNQCWRHVVPYQQQRVNEGTTRPYLEISICFLLWSSPPKC